MGRESPASSRRLVLTVIVALWAVLFVIRFAGPVDLVSRDQGLSCAYILDTAYNGHWVSAVDHHGDPASKPPLHNWLGALAVLGLGPTRFAVALPSALATLGTALWLVMWGGARFGARAGGIAAFVFLLSHLPIKLLPVVRPDPLFAFLVVVAAGCAFDAWRGRAGWWPFWIFATLASMTKGPFGLLLGLAGLAAIPWIRRDGDRVPSSARWWPGCVLFIAVHVGWLLLGWWQLGRPFLDEVLGEELFGHVTTNDRGRPLWATFWQPTAYLLARWLPWSVLLVPTAVRIVSRPAADVEERALERYFLTAIAVGLAVLSLAAHKRGDLVAPLIPMAALLVGRQIDLWTADRSRVTQVWAAVLALAVLVPGFGAYHFRLRSGDAMALNSAARHALAAEIVECTSDVESLQFALRSYQVQFHLGSTGREVRSQDALDALAEEPAVWFVVYPMRPFLEAAARGDIEVHVLLEGDRDHGVVSNRESWP